jgi:hypothetical protein
MQNLPFDSKSKAGFVFLLEGIPRTPKADDRHVERSPSALREEHS